MSEILASEHELASFLEDIESQEMKTWERQRTADELGGFVLRRLSVLDDLGEDLI